MKKDKVMIRVDNRTLKILKKKAYAYDLIIRKEVDVFEEIIDCCSYPEYKFKVTAKAFMTKLILSKTEWTALKEMMEIDYD